MTKIIRSGRPEWDGQAFDLSDPRIPPSIARAVRKMASAGDTLYFADTDAGGEWWLIDEAGELLESFWLEG